MVIWVTSFLSFALRYGMVSWSFFAQQILRVKNYARLRGIGFIGMVIFCSKDL